MWLRHEEFTCQVNNTWNQITSSEDKWTNYLHSLGLVLQDWNVCHFGNTKAKIKHLKKELEQLRSSSRDSDTSARECALTREIDEWLIREEILWKQQARTDWILEGDNNTKFFHRRASSRQRKTSLQVWKMNQTGYVQILHLWRIL